MRLLLLLPLLLLLLLLLPALPAARAERLPRTQYSFARVQLSAKQLVRGFGCARNALLEAHVSVSALNATTTAAAGGGGGGGIAEEAGSQTFVVLTSEKQSTGWYDRSLDLTTKNTGAGGATEEDETVYTRLCSLPAVAKYEVPGAVGATLNVSLEVLEPDRYTLWLLHCSTDVAIDISVKARARNPNVDGEIKQHLPIQQTPLPNTYIAFSVLYLGMFVAFASEVFFVPHNKVQSLHYVFLATVGTRFLRAVTKYAFYASQNHVGELTDAALYTANIFDGLSDLCFMLSLLLLSVGWTMVRETLSPREAKLNMSVFAAYLALVLSMTECNPDNNSGSCGSLRLTLYVLRSLLLLSVIVAINFNITHLRNIIMESPWDRTLPRFYLALHHYHTFRWVFLSFLLIPTLLLIIEVTILSWQFEWTVIALEEMLYFVIYTHVGFAFGPTPTVLLERAFDGSLEEQDRHLAAADALVGAGALPAAAAAAAAAAAIPPATDAATTSTTTTTAAGGGGGGGGPLY